jgi:hypothetical protein
MRLFPEWYGTWPITTSVVIRVFCLIPAVTSLIVPPAVPVAGQGWRQRAAAGLHQPDQLVLTDQYRAAGHALLDQDAVTLVADHSRMAFGALHGHLLIKRGRFPARFIQPCRSGVNHSPRNAGKCSGFALPWRVARGHLVFSAHMEIIGID